MKREIRRRRLLGCRGVAIVLSAAVAAALAGSGCRKPQPEFPGGWPAHAPKHIKTVKCEYVLEMLGTRGSPTRIYYRLPRDYRLHMVFGAQTYVRNKDGLFRQSELWKNAVRLDPSAGVAAPFNPALFDQVIAASKKIGRRRLHGKMCDLYEFKTSVGGPRKEDKFGLGGAKIWVWPEGRIVLQSYMSSGKKMSVKFFCRSLRYNEPMPDSLFRLPKGTPVLDEEPFVPEPHKH